MAKSLPEQIAALSARIEADTAKRAELLKIQESTAALAGVASGDSIDFVYGRKENRITRNGQVLHVDRDDTGAVKTIRILAGTGADVNVYNVSLNDVKAVHKPGAFAEGQAEQTA